MGLKNGKRLQHQPTMIRIGVPHTTLCGGRANGAEWRRPVKGRQASNVFEVPVRKIVC